MSADLLREAAEAMRRNAKTAQDRIFPRTWREVVEALSDDVQQQHVASWHPAVALTVADWLNSQADQHDYLVETGTMRDHDTCSGDMDAEAVARAYLGRS